MKGTKWSFLIILIGLSFVNCAYGGFLNSLSDTINDAGNTLSEASDKIVDGAKEVGQETGVMKKENKPAKQSTNNSTQNYEKLDCDGWTAKLNTFTAGDRALKVYMTEDKNQITKWKEIYLQAKPVSNAYSKSAMAGDCGGADSKQKWLTAKISQFEEMYPDELTAKSSENASNIGKFIFATQPLLPGQTSHSQQSFKAGDNIYGLVEVAQPWGKIYGKKNNVNIMVNAKIDGKKIHAQFIKLKSEEYCKRTFLIFNVAPKIEELQAYSDSNIEFGKTTAVIKQGPNELSHHLGKLNGGKHTVAFEIQYYGKKWAAGSFDISGDSFKAYAALHEKIAKGVVAARTLPTAKSTNKKLGQEMQGLLVKAGWKNIYRLNIVDKDWWMVRSNGSNSPVVGRYMDAVALTEFAKGQYHYKRCSFHQDKLLSGGFGPLYISKQGEAVPVAKENIDK